MSLLLWSTQCSPPASLSSAPLHHSPRACLASPRLRKADCLCGSLGAAPSRHRELLFRAGEYLFCLRTPCVVLPNPIPGFCPDFTFPKGFAPPKKGLCKSHTHMCMFSGCTGYWHGLEGWVPCRQGVVSPALSREFWKPGLCWLPSPPGPTHRERILREPMDRGPSSGGE